MYDWIKLVTEVVKPLARRAQRNSRKVIELFSSPLDDEHPEFLDRMRF